MNIRVWIDFACPFCYIGETRLIKAIERLKINPRLEFLSFQLDPSLKNSNEDYLTQLGKKYNVGLEGAKSMTDRIVRLAENDGIVFDFEKIVNSNTFPAHVGLKYAQKHGKGIEFLDLTMKAYFSEGKDIGSKEQLAQLAESIGMDSEEFTKCFDDPLYIEEVQKDLAQGKNDNVTSVPQFIINDKTRIVGAQEEKYFVDTLKKLNDH